jgi:hypothetical protein
VFIEDQVTAPREFHGEGRLIWEEVNFLAAMIRSATVKDYRTRYEYRVRGGEKEKTHIVVSSDIEPERPKNKHG